MNKTQYFKIFIVFSLIIINWVSLDLVLKGLTYPSDASCLMAVIGLAGVIIFDYEVIKSIFLTNNNSTKEKEQNENE